MRLTRFSDIGLRVLMYLAREADATRITVADISSYFDIPHNHLVKVVGALVKLGWVGAARGRNGGIHLAADPGAIRVGAVLRALEGHEEVVDCEGLQCRLAADCVLRGALRAGMDAFYVAMDRYTLGDIASGGNGEQVMTWHRSMLGGQGASPGAAA